MTVETNPTCTAANSCYNRPMIDPNPTPAPALPEASELPASPALPEEFGGKKRLEPTRYGDWELNGKCVDF